jgi:hypothetical protein
MRGLAMAFFGGFDDERARAQDLGGGFAGGVPVPVIAMDGVQFYTDFSR